MGLCVGGPSAHGRDRQPGDTRDQSTANKEALMAIGESMQLEGSARTQTQPAPRTITAGAARFLAVFRVVLGFEFLWAFLDKTFGLGYATPTARAWINGGSPTKGFLSTVAVGPFEATFHAWAGAAWADWLFMVGLLGIGVALIVGVGLRIAAVSGTLLMLGMWAAAWPVAQGTSAGGPPLPDHPHRRLPHHLRPGPDRPGGDLRRQRLGSGPAVGQAAVRAAQPLAALTASAATAGATSTRGRAGGHRNECQRRPKSDPWRRCLQPVIATTALSVSDGVFHPGICRGRLLRAWAMAFRSLSERSGGRPWGASPGKCRLLRVACRASGSLPCGGMSWPREPSGAISTSALAGCWLARRLPKASSRLRRWSPLSVGP